MTERGFGIEWRSQSQFHDFMRDQEVEVAKLMGALGMLKK
jgi:hypothetical protein